MLSGDTGRGARILRRVLADAHGADDPTRLIWDSIAAFYVGDVAGAAQLLGRATRLARVADMTGSLPYALELYAAAERAQGRLASAAALATEGLSLARETQQDSSAAVHLATLAGIAAVQGRADECRTAADAALALAVPRRLGLAAGLASHALALSSLLHGRYSEALQQFNALARAGPGGTHPVVTWYSLPDRVEAAVRAGDRAAAAEALAQLEQWVTVSTGAATRALLLRCRALLAPAGDAEVLYRDALATHPAGELPLEQARTQLLYGEWLRRERRRVEAREHLREAQDALHRIGAEPLAERAHTELRATGETARRRDPTVTARLTPQELQIARLVAEGASNGDVAARSSSAAAPSSTTSTRSTPSLASGPGPSSRTRSPPMRAWPAEAGVGHWHLGMPPRNACRVHGIVTCGRCSRRRRAEPPWLCQRERRGERADHHHELVDRSEC